MAREAAKMPSVLLASETSSPSKPCSATPTIDKSECEQDPGTSISSIYSLHSSSYFLGPAHEPSGPSRDGSFPLRRDREFCVERCDATYGNILALLEVMLSPYKDSLEHFLNTSQKSQKSTSLDSHSRSKKTPAEVTLEAYESLYCVLTVFAANIQVLSRFRKASDSSGRNNDDDGISDTQSTDSD
jgi:hypothetical protein